MKMARRVAAVLAGALTFAGVAWGATGTSGAVTVRSQGGYNVAGHAVVGYPPFQVGSGVEAAIWLDGAVLFSTAGNASWDWQPQTTGNHKLEFRLNGVAVTSKTVNVTSLAFAVQKAPNPPTAANTNISITPVTRNFGTGGGGGAIVVSGSGTWTASASESWITLNVTTGAVGYPVAYTVGATTNVESRTGYVYVSGHTHTVTQDGLGGSISPTSATFESAGGTGTITVTAPERMGWQARANCNWVRVNKTSGTGPGSVTFTVAPMREVVTRQGTLTVAGNTFTVFQYGRRMGISPVKAEYDYLTHVIPITVDALAITEWTVTPQNSWISVVDGGNGKGSDLVTVAIAENPSWKARTGTVKIGTETFTVTQKGRTALEFGISPASTTASVEGANGLIAVTATPDLPWSAASQANWLTVYAATASGAGNGNVAYSAAPNPTLYGRTGTIVVTPGDTKVSAKTHTVTQPAAVSALSGTGYEFAAAGESCGVKVSLSDIVQWQIDNKVSWITVSGTTNRVGPGTVTLQAAPNDTVYPRSGTVTIARKTFKVSQKARGVEVEYDTKLFGTDGGEDSISVHPDGQVSWTAVSSDPTWIVLFSGASGTGNGEILYIVAPYVGTGEARTGTITVGNKVVYITQRAYDLSIDPKGAVVPGNNGAGEFGVSATIDAVWRAIVTEPWITLVSGYDAGTGNGTVRFVYTDNDTGKVRTGKIIVAGEVYTLEQKARQFVAVTAEAGHGGRVEGGGSYDLGAEVTLTAIPDSGYAFSYWTGAVESMENPLKVRVDVPKTYTAVFEPLSIAFESVVSGTNGVTLAWNNLAWATHYLLYRGVTSVPSSATVLADIPNTGDCTWLDETGDDDIEYWYWIEAEGPEDDVMSDPMTGTKRKHPFPDVKDEARVAAVLADAADARLGERIRSMEEYQGFRAWMAEKGIEQQRVKDSVHAWVSYMLGSDELFGNEPTIRIGGVAFGGGDGTRDAAGMVMDVEVSVLDGNRVVAVDAAKVAAMFEATDDLRDWENGPGLTATATLAETNSATMQFHVVPDASLTDEGFLRLSLKSLQTIAFAPIGAQTVTNRVPLAATATSGGTVTFEVVSGPGVVEGNVLSFTGNGRVVVRAVQAGNSQWGAASATQSVPVACPEEGVVQLWEGGPYWADRNIGAENPWDYGLYFWWGDTVGYRREGDAWVASDGAEGRFSFSKENTPTYDLSLDTSQSEGWITAEGVLAPEHDAAQVHWGGGWRMPTVEDLDDMFDNCNREWTTVNGVNGVVVRGRGNYANNSIFFPYSGYGSRTLLGEAGFVGAVWSSSPDGEESVDLDFNFGGFGYDPCPRDAGFPIRPVRVPTE